MDCKDYTISSHQPPVKMFSVSPNSVNMVVSHILSLALLASCTAHATYIISPHCVGNDTGCLTLSDAAKQADNYFTNNTTLIFIPGDHNLGDVVSIANITGLTLISSTELRPRILCDKSSFSFFNVSNVRIESISFISCPMDFSSSVAKLYSCWFDNSTAEYGGALALYEGSNVQLSGESKFVGNMAKIGGAVFVDSSNLTFQGQSTFHGNTASDGPGGAVGAWMSNTVSFNGTNIFYNNTARLGGTVLAVESNIVEFIGISIFHDNTARDGYGGAVDAETNNTVSFNGTSTFHDNIAMLGGGAMLAGDSNTVSFSGTSTFHDNTAQYDGGAMFAGDNNTVSFSGTSTFHDNTAQYDGGAMFAGDSNTVSFSGTNTFHGNIAMLSGGALCAWDSNRVSITGTSTFHNNTAKEFGGAVDASINNTVSFSGTSTFQGNTADHKFGGAVSAWQSNTLSISGISTFLDNTCYNGGAIFAVFTNAVSLSGTSTFHGNTAQGDGGGAVYAAFTNTVSFSGCSTFCDNTGGDAGGAVYVTNTNTVSFNGTSTFHNNTASDEGGGAVGAWKSNSVSFSGTSTFHNNSALSGVGGAVYAGEYNNVSFRGNNSFFGNKAKSSGGGISSVRQNTIILYGINKLSGNRALFGGGVSAEIDSTVELIGITEISENQATYGGGMFVDHGYVAVSCISARLNSEIFSSELELAESEIAKFNASHCVVFNGNSASQRGYGGAIHAISTILHLEGNYLITANTAKFGGGFALSGVENKFFLKPGIQMVFTENTALGRGGALYIEDSPFTYCTFEDSVERSRRESCFFQIFEGECVSNNKLALSSNSFYYFHGDYNSTTIMFKDNTAIESGGSLYGGELEHCAICIADEGWSYTGVEVFQIFTRDQNNISELEVASDPMKVCICEGGVPNCSRSSMEATAYPGETLSVSLVAVGQLDGVVPSVIRAVPKELQLPSEYITQSTGNRNCTKLHYPLLTNNVDTTATLELYSDEPCSTSGYAVTVSITIHPCPTGFSLSSQGECNCEDRLRAYTQECNITNQTITRHEGNSFWAGVDYQDNILTGLILHPHCPFDYCTEDTVVFSLKKPDAQCRDGRSGTLCGACEDGYSLALGSSRCISDCSNTFLALLLAFIAAGLALVFFLLICNLTVAKGSLNGLILYANILAINQTVFFPSSDGKVMTNCLTVFIAWLNLDFGIETCFFTGLDIYSRTWLQFAFPFYIWVLVGLIAYLADISTTVAKLLSHTNPVAVLATLFLLSYTKLLRTFMAAFSFTTLSYPEKTRVVWLYDGNIGYWDSKHLVLLLVSFLVFCILYLPYMVFLVCGRWVQRKFQLRWISPAKQLYIKSFWDAYYAPYRDRHCYWPGLLLLVRFIILLISTVINIRSPQDPHTNLLVVGVVVTCLLMWNKICHGVYRMWYHNILEDTFLVNLIFLCMGTYHVRQSAGNQAALVYTSVSIAFVTFTMIVAVAVVQLTKTHFSKSIWLKIKKVCQRTQSVDYHEVPQEEPTEEPCQTPAATTVIVEIDRNKMSGFANYRETALDLVSL